MSDENLFEVFEGDDIFEEEEDGEIRGEPEGEGQNKTFLIAVGILGGLLVLAIGFFAIWALVLNPRMQANKISEAAVTPEPVAETVEPTEDAAAMADDPTEMPEPTATSELKPTETPVIKPTNTPEPEEGEGEGDAESSTAVEAATEAPRKSATPTSTARPTSTPKPTESATALDPNTSSTESGAADGLPDSGAETWVLIIAGAVLIGVAFMARKLRSA